MSRAKQAHNKIMNELFKYDNNPTYELCGITLINLFGLEIVNEMEDENLIKYIGQNHNNLSVYQVRQ
jgi:hypothetical protein